MAPAGAVLGISPLDKDATACLYVEGAWHATAEERLSRVKLHPGFPRLAVAELLERTGLRPQDLSRVVYPFMPWWREGGAMVAGLARDSIATLRDNLPVAARSRHLRAHANWCVRGIREHRARHAELARELAALGLGKPVRVDHHRAHAAGAYLTSGFERALAITLDWYGGGLSGSVSACGPEGIERLHAFRYPHSLGLFYAQATSALGFVAARHEGKVVGLAAYGDPEVAAPALMDRLVRAGGDFQYRAAMDPQLALSLTCAYAREDVAAAYQHVLERVGSGIAAHWVRASGLTDVVLAGGVVANVKLNQRIAELEEVSRVFVHPNMGDGGTGVGAVLAFLLERGEAVSREWETCSLGPEFTEDDLSAAVRDAGLEARRVADLPRELAPLLAAGNVVARFTGRVEYGPRALGNRSILCRATDTQVNASLNARLGRTEFMPFAPATLAEHCRERYEGIDKCLASARFMTVTCRCTELMRSEAPAAVHVDGTARPQVVRREDSPDLHAIIEAYRLVSGIPTVINTSFNMHEEPIVCSPADAVRAFREGGLDYLALGPFLVQGRA